MMENKVRKQRWMFNPSKENDSVFIPNICRFQILRFSQTLLLLIFHDDKFHVLDKINQWRTSPVASGGLIYIFVL